MKTKDLNRFKGCLFGGAIGDALGYAVEFMNIEQIRELYGQDGIQAVQLIDGKALISDDTQMTLFTANGLLTGQTLKRLKGESRPIEFYIHNAYMDWQRTQRLVNTKNGAKNYSWLTNMNTMHTVRAPGGTCLRSLTSGIMGTMEHPINSSKGCGGVMRVSPIALYYSQSEQPIEETDLIGAKCAALTHGHPLGFLSAAALVHIINQTLYGNFPRENMLFDIVEDCIQSMEKNFAQYPKVTDLTSLLRQSLELAEEGGDDLTSIAKLGEGWVAEEALSISVYCALRHSHDFQKALTAAANHSGDSDSTASITGNILGSLLGYDAIPTTMIERLELADILHEISQDLYTDSASTSDAHCRTELWQRKYLRADYRL